MKQAKDIMTKTVLTVTLDTPVIKLAELLTTNNINGAPVVDESGNVLGVVTENDLIYQKKKVHIPTMLSILDSFIYLESPEKMRQEMQKITGTTVKDIYSQSVITVNEDTPLDEIATVMAEKNIHTIPVLRGDTLVGVIGKRDIIKTLIP